MPAKQYWIIDDDPIARILIRKKMAKGHPDFQVLEFTNGQEALAKVEGLEMDRAPMFILLDLNMPIMNGWEFLEECHERLKSLNVNIAILTSSIDEKDKRKAHDYDGIVCFLNKPLKLELLEEYFPRNLIKN